MKSKWDQTQKPKEQKWFYEIPKYFRHSTRNIIQVLFPTRWKANTARAEIVFKFDFKQNSGWTLLLRFKFKCNITQRSSLPNMCWYKTTRFTNHKIIENNFLMSCSNVNIVVSQAKSAVSLRPFTVKNWSCIFVKYT